MSCINCQCATCVHIGAQNWNTNFNQHNYPHNYAQNYTQIEEAQRLCFTEASKNNQFQTKSVTKEEVLQMIKEALDALKSGAI